MEDFCDRIPGQHTGRLSLEHQAREAAEWQRKVDDLQKQLDSANRIIQIKDETISLLEKRCNNLREELDELSDRVSVLHERIIEQNNAIRNAVKTPPAAGESPGISPEPAQAHGLSEHQLRAIGEAVSALRFCASQNDWYTEARATELRNIANTLTGIEIDAAATPSAAVGASEPVAESHDWCANKNCPKCNARHKAETTGVSNPPPEMALVYMSDEVREAAGLSPAPSAPPEPPPVHCGGPYVVREVFERVQKERDTFRTQRDRNEKKLQYLLLKIQEATDDLWKIGRPEKFNSALGDVLREV